MESTPADRPSWALAHSNSNARMRMADDALLVKVASKNAQKRDESVRRSRRRENIARKTHANYRARAHLAQATIPNRARREIVARLIPRR